MTNIQTNECNLEEHDYYLATQAGLHTKGKHNDNHAGSTRAMQMESSMCYRDSFEQIMSGLRLFQSVCACLVNNAVFQSAIIALIGISCIMMGIATSDFVTENEKVSAMFDFIDKIFLIIFTVEIAMQLITYGYKVFFDYWLRLDLLIVMIAWVLHDTDFVSVQMLRALRIIRALRLITRMKTMTRLVSAFMNILHRMASITMMLFLIFYMYAVVFTTLFKDMYKEGLTEDNYFSRIDYTFFTLFQIMTLDGWANICREVMQTYAWAWVPFFMFVVMSAFIVINIILAMITEIVSKPEKDPGYIQSALSREWEAVATPISIKRKKVSKLSTATGLSEEFYNRGAGRSFSMMDMQRKIDCVSHRLDDVVDVLDDIKRSIENVSKQVEKLQRSQSERSEQRDTDTVS